MKRILCSASALSLLLCVLAARPALAGDSFVFFKGTQYPLSVTFIKGRLPGPTVMVQGGIQGDEPSGCLSAEILSRSRVERGNLIVLPRANVPSINLFRRQVNVDMNRRFDQDYNLFYEDRVARAIRFLLSKSDAFIHLHEGSGFYDPEYRDSLRNPMRYGQSIIVDTLALGRGVDLGGIAAGVLERLNQGVQDRDRRFRLFNTRTFEERTLYPEQRKSLTYYAISALKIPALAVEVSKDIRDLDWKVRRQLEATVMLLAAFGVEAEPPAVDSERLLAKARREAVRVNGLPLNAGGVIDLAPGSTLSVEPVGPHPDLCPSLAVFASDRPGVNLITAPRMALESFSLLELRSDGRSVAQAPVRWTGALPPSPGGETPVFVCWLNGRPVFVRSGQALKAVAGDQLILEGMWGSRAKEVINLKGYVAKPWANDGQDMGWEIVLDPDNFMDKYRVRLDQAGALRFRVVRETPGAGPAQFFLDIAPRRVHAVRLADEHGQALVVPWNSGASFFLSPGRYVFMNVWSNGSEDKLVPLAGDRPLSPGGSFQLGLDSPVKISLRQATTFSEIGEMTFRAGGLAQHGASFLN
ncbi:MAG: M14/M99 family metallopeptidase [Desulfovibrionaceae bacterium]|nr:M14/M99 family metallopeptidase [Desulfovibrionaceae bacterium]